MCQLIGRPHKFSTEFGWKYLIPYMTRKGRHRFLGYVMRYLQLVLSINSRTFKLAAVIRDEVTALRGGDIPGRQNAY